MKSLELATLLLLTAAASAAHADAELATRQGCMGCHGVSQRVVGPSFAEVAQRRGKTPEAEAALIKAIREGGSGVWGQVPMPAQPQLSDADAAALARWVLRAGSP